MQITYEDHIDNLRAQVDRIMSRVFSRPRAGRTAVSMPYSPGKTFGSSAPPKVYSGAEEWIDGPCVTKQWHDRRADDTPRAVRRLRSQIPQ